MRLCMYEDARAALLEPLTLTRPAAALRLGAETLLERQRRALAADAVGAWVRPELAELTRQVFPGLPVNEPNWLREGRTVYINARWRPDAQGGLDPRTPHIGVVRDQIAYLALPEPAAPAAGPIDNWLVGWQGRLPARDAGG